MRTWGISLIPHVLLYLAIMLYKQFFIYLKVLPFSLSAGNWIEHVETVTRRFVYLCLFLSLLTIEK